MINENLLKAASFYPRTLFGESAWIGHLPFVFYLFSERKPKKVVELGTHFGHSYFAMCEAVKTLNLDTQMYAIDTWEGDVHAGGYAEEVFQSVSTTNDRWYSEFSALLRGRFEEKILEFDDGTIDVLHIDGLHTYEAVCEDFTTWLPKMKHDGIILFHDTNVKNNNFGVWKLWEELSVKYPLNLNFTHSHGLGVLQLSNCSNIKDGIIDMLNETAHHKEIYKEYFSALGSSHYEKFLLNETKNKNEFLNKKNKDLEWYVETRVNTIALLEARINQLTVYGGLNYWRTVILQKIPRGLESTVIMIVGKIYALLKKIFTKFKNRLSKFSSMIKLVGRSFKTNGFLLTVKKITTKIKSNSKIISGGHGGDFSEGNLSKVFDDKFFNTTKILNFKIEGSERRRINIVTDSIGPSSLFGGVGTALIIGTQISERFGCDLRIITRTEKPNPEDFGTFLKAIGLNFSREVVFDFSPLDGGRYIDVTDGDIFITTSWWSTAAALKSFDEKKILYLLQEDERMFYPYGDERRLCQSVLENSNIHFLINTELLFDHLVVSGLKNIKSNGIWFEPAFSEDLYCKKDNKKLKKKFMFYARPNNPRNLYYMGLEVINSAIKKGVFDLQEWDIYLVGKNIPNITFDSGYEPKIVNDMSWDQYLKFISDVDICLSLMYTPHPSYPPLDLAASGSVVVTNKFKNKQDLDRYSKNIICCDLNLDSLIDGIEFAKLTISSQTHAINYSNQPLPRNWNDSIDKIKLFVDKEYGV